MLGNDVTVLSSSLVVAQRYKDGLAFHVISYRRMHRGLANIRYACLRARDIGEITLSMLDYFLA